MPDWLIPLICLVVLVGFIGFAFRQGLRVRPDPDKRNDWTAVPPSDGPGTGHP